MGKGAGATTVKAVNLGLGAGEAQDKRGRIGPTSG